MDRLQQAPAACQADCPPWCVNDHKLDGDWLHLSADHRIEGPLGGPVVTCIVKYAPGQPAVIEIRHFEVTITELDPATAVQLGDALIRQAREADPYVFAGPRRKLPDQRGHRHGGGS